MKNIIKISLVIIATLVGAGFASGKEIYSFFFIYGIKGIIGIFISSFIISVVIYKVLKICNDNNINTYQEFCGVIGNAKKYVKNNENNLKIINNKNLKYSKLLNNIVNIFLLITYYIMISGFSSFLNQEFNINEIIGSITIILLCYFTFLKNINGLIKVSDYLIPIFIIFLIFISLKNIDVINNYNNIFSNITILPKGGIIKSILYACYNCIILIPVLVTLQNVIKNRKSILGISVTVFIIIIVLSFSIYNLLLQGNENIFGLEMPIIEIVKKYGVIYKIIYIVMIGISIFTTAISAGCGFLNNCTKSKDDFKMKLIIMSITGVFLSQIKFSVLVNLLYPVLGIVGVFEIILLFK